jgi:hypothetical protein
MPTATHRRGWTRRRLAVAAGLVLVAAVVVTPLQWYAAYRAVRCRESTTTPSRTASAGVDDYTAV